MKDKISRVLIIDILVLLLWVTTVLLLSDIENVKYNFWIAFGFGVVAYVIGGISILMTKRTGNRNLTEIKVIPVFVTEAYVTVAVAINSLYIFTKTEDYVKLIVIVNLIIFVAFISYRMFIGDYMTRVETQSQKINNMTQQITMISASLSNVISVTSDVEVKKALLRLKESIDYSNNMTQNVSVGLQNQMMGQIATLNTMVQSGADKDSMLRQVDEANKIWKMRNSSTNSFK